MTIDINKNWEEMSEEERAAAQEALSTLFATAAPVFKQIGELILDFGRGIQKAIESSPDIQRLLAEDWEEEYWAWKKTGKAVVPKHEARWEKCPWLKYEASCYQCCSECNYDRHTCHFCGDELRHDNSRYEDPIGTPNPCYVEADKELARGQA